MTCIENRICNVSNCGCDAKAKAFLPWEKCSDEQFMPIFWLPSEYNSYNFDTNKEYLYKNLTKAYNDSRKEKRD